MATTKPPNQRMKLPPEPPDDAPASPPCLARLTDTALSKGMSPPPFLRWAVSGPAAPVQLMRVRYVAGSAFGDDHKE